MSQKSKDWDEANGMNAGDTKVSFAVVYGRPENCLAEIRRNLKVGLPEGTTEKCRTRKCKTRLHSTVQNKGLHKTTA